jgi:hypothetical protein
MASLCQPTVPVAPRGHGHHGVRGVRVPQGWHRAWSRRRKLTESGDPWWGGNDGLGGDTSGSVDELWWKAAAETGSCSTGESRGSEMQWKNG